MNERYAIRLPDGNYVSNARVIWGGPKSAPLQKAKLWTSLSHVKSHLGTTSVKYPEGSQIVEIEIVYKANVIGEVETFVAGVKKRSAERKQEAEVRSAKHALEAAERNLAEARARVGRRGR